MKVLLTMANNTSTPYFSRFADLEKKDPSINLIFLCLFPTEPDMIDEMREKGFECYWIKYDRASRKSQLVLSFFRCLKLLFKIKPSVVHSHLFEDSLPVLLASYILGVKKRVISKLDAGYHYNFAKKWVFLDRMNNRLATDIVAVSEENRDFIIDIEKANPNKVTLIYQGLPEQELESGNKDLREKLIDKYDLENKRIILNVARYIEWKGQHKIIAAAKMLVEEYPDLKFLFFGAGDFKQNLEELVEENGLGKSIHLGDWISRDELNILYEICDIYCNASINEPFGFVIAEALLKRIPLVTTKTGAASSLLVHKEHAYIVDGTPKSIYDGIKQVLESGTDKLVSKGYALAKQHFTAEKMWAGHKKLYLKS